MASGYHDFTAGETLTAANLEDYCELQGVMRFASAAARNAALAAVLEEGMCAFLVDTNTITVYSGSAWSTVGPAHGGLTTWTPTWTQSATITKTVTQATYSRVGRQVTANFSLTASSAGTASNSILFGLPVAAATGVVNCGQIIILDASAPVYFTGTAFVQGGSTFGVITTGATGLMTGLNGGNAIASGDIAYACLSYEASADA